MWPWQGLRGAELLANHPWGKSRAWTLTESIHERCNGVTAALDNLTRQKAQTAPSVRVLVQHSRNGESGSFYPSVHTVTVCLTSTKLWSGCKQSICIKQQPGQKVHWPLADILVTLIWMANILTASVQKGSWMQSADSAGKGRAEGAWLIHCFMEIPSRWLG
jgi:hypothetical protein